MAVVLVCGAGLLIRAFDDIQSASNGFRAEGISTFRIALGWRRYGSREQITRYYEQTQQTLANAPGVSGVAFGSAPPLMRQEQDENNVIQLDGQSAVEAASNPFPHVQFISENYLEVLKLPLVSGRAFTRFDGEKGDPVALVSQRLAERLWPGQNALGKRIALNRSGTAAPAFRTVVGITGNVRQRQLAETASLDLYIPYRQSNAANQYLLVKTNLDDSAFRALSENILWRIDSEQSLFDFQTYTRRILDGLWQLRLSRMLLILFGGAALLLAAAGIFGLMSYLVNQRQRELGIRLALGAQPGMLRFQIVGQGVRIALGGLLLGTAGAYMAGSAIRSLLTTAKTFDLISYAATVLVVLASSILASAWPAERAARVDPIIALREE